MSLQDVKSFFAGLASWIHGSPDLRFAWDTLRRVFLFVVIALSAVGLHSIVELLHTHGTPTNITAALTLIEYLILVADVVWISKPLVEEIVTTLKQMFSGHPLMIAVAVILVFLIGAVSGSDIIAKIKEFAFHIIESDK